MSCNSTTKKENELLQRELELTKKEQNSEFKEIEEKKSALDIILDKIHESGMESLSAKEKEQLKELSQS